MTRGMSQQIHPTETEIEFLDLAYIRFLDLFDEMVADDFWARDPMHRLSKIKDVFLVYSETLKYPPIQWAINGTTRPNFADVGKDLFKFIRHVLSHFPFFAEWDMVWISKPIVSLYSSSPQFIDRYLTDNENRDELKYRFWEEDKKSMTYVCVQFPSNYTSNGKIFLKDMLEEKSGVKFSLIFMNTILRTQIEEIRTK